MTTRSARPTATRLCWFLLPLSTGCHKADNTPRTDREHYLASIDAEPEDATALCMQIGEDSMRGECVVSATKRQLAVRNLAVASQSCTDLDVQPWRDECWFMVAEASDDPSQACAKAGRFRLFCLGHQATNQMLAATDLPLAIGEEVALETEIRKRLANGPNLGHKHTETVVKASMARILAKRWARGPFDANDCGQVRPDVCVRAYSETMGMALDGVNMANICGAPITQDSVVVNGGQDWVAGSEDFVLDAWKHLCKAWEK